MGEPLSLILQHMNAYNDTMLLRCAINLNLPDIIHRLSGDGDGATLSRVAAALHRQPVNTNHLHRILHALVHIGLLTNELESGYYTLSSASELFLLGEKSLGPYILLMTNPFGMSLWDDLGAAPFIETSVTEAKHGAPAWKVFAGREELRGLFNEGMAAYSRVLVPSVVDALAAGGVFDGATTSLVDVGGGTGTAAAGVKEKFPHVRCMVMDLPHVVRAATTAGRAVSSTVEFIEGDMLELVPRADVVMLMRVLHDWGDVECVKILERCKEAMPKEIGRLILVNMVMEEEEEEEDKDPLAGWKLRLDLAMMLLHGGKERSQNQWNSLLHEAGFYIHTVTPVLLGMSVTEARLI